MARHKKITTKEVKTLVKRCDASSPLSTKKKDAVVAFLKTHVPCNVLSGCRDSRQKSLSFWLDTERHPSLSKHFINTCTRVWILHIYVQTNAQHRDHILTLLTKKYRERFLRFERLVRASLKSLKSNRNATKTCSGLKALIFHPRQRRREFRTESNIPVVAQGGVIPDRLVAKVLASKRFCPLISDVLKTMERGCVVVQNSRGSVISIATISIDKNTGYDSITRMLRRQSEPHIQVEYLCGSGQGHIKIYSRLSTLHSSHDPFWCTGGGTAAISVVASYAKVLGKRAVYLGSEFEAISFYERLGFVPTLYGGGETLRLELKPKRLASTIDVRDPHTGDPVPFESAVVAGNTPGPIRQVFDEYKTPYSKIIGLYKIEEVVHPDDIQMYKKKYIHADTSKSRQSAKPHS